MGRLRTANKRLRHSSARQAAVQSPALVPWLLDASLPPRTRGGQVQDAIEIVGVAAIPGGGCLHLAQSGRDFSIQFCTDELMGSVDHVSEEALATLTYERLASKDGRVLIGGLGMGFTLRAVLGVCGPSARIVVAELVPEVLAWAKDQLAHLHGESLSDPRVSIEVADVHDMIDRAEDVFDAILLDVDNGPDGFMRSENDRLYCNWGLRSAYAALRPAGVLAAWSAYPDPGFHRRLDQVGFDVEEAIIPGCVNREGENHRIWLATKP